MAAKIKKVLLVLFTALLTVLVLCASWLAFDKHVLKHKVPTIFGYGYVAISLDALSMSGVIEAGDLIIIKSCDEYKTGDIITYLEDTGNNTVKIVTHQIVRIDETKEGINRYVTLGVANQGVEDTNPKIEIYGKVVDVYSQLGLILRWIKDEGYMYLIGFLLLIGSSFIVFRKEKEEA